MLKSTKVTADSGYHSEANAKYLFERGIDGYLADNLFRKRDPRFATAERHVPKREAEPWARPKTRGLYKAADLRIAEDLSHAICPAGKRLYRTLVRQFAVLLGRLPGKPETYTARMKRKIDTDRGRHEYARRLGTVEPVFANINHVRRLKRFSLRGAAKVNIQWLLYCLVHNIGKVQRYGGTANEGGDNSEMRH